MKKNLLSVEVGKEIESNLDVDEKIVCTTMQNEVNLSQPPSLRGEGDEEAVPY